MKSFSQIALATFGVFAAGSIATAATVNFSGDARFRTERDWFEHFAAPSASGSAANASSTSADNLYARTRFRLKAEVQVNDEISATARLTTGKDQYSTHYTLGGSGTGSGNGFGARWPFNLDQAFLNYKIAETMHLQLGKVPVSYWTAGNSVSGTMWNDQSFEGLQAKWMGDFGTFKPYATANYAVLLERIQASGVANSSSVGWDPTLFGIQLGTKWASDDLAANLAVGSYNYSGIKGFNTSWTNLGSTYFAGARGNTLDGSNNFVYDYQTLAVDAEVTYTFGFAPLSLFGSYITNNEGENKTGMHGGAKLGTLKDIGSWFVAAVYKDFGRDAFFANYSETTNSFGGAGLRAMEFSAGYQMFPNANLTLAYHSTTHDLVDGTNGRADLYLLDMNASF